MTTHEKGHKTGGRRNGAGRKPRQGWVKVGYSLQSSTIALLNAYVERTGRLKSEILKYRSAAVSGSLACSGQR
jgi:hypothetical protein